jgi:hypothetical protein
MSGHTRGPWEISKIGNPYNQFMVYAKGGALICNSVEGEENARLIAAAPELLEAAHRYVQGVLLGSFDYLGSSECDTDFNALKAACEKAEGGA